MQDIGIEGGFDEVWVTFDVEGQRQRLPLLPRGEEGVPFAAFLIGEYACDPSRRSFGLCNEL